MMYSALWNEPFSNQLVESNGCPRLFMSEYLHCRKVIATFSNTFKPVLPFVLQTTASMGAYTAGLALSQALGASLRISCATPVLGSLGGMAGVGLASIAAGQASLSCTAALRSPSRDIWSFLEGMPKLDAKRAMIDVLLGVTAFKLVGGSFRSIMPSDLTKIGAIAKESMPAAGMQYAGEEKRRELLRMYRRDGCHHCGTRKGMVIGDHMPPNKHVQQHAETAMVQLVDRMYKVPSFRTSMQLLGISPLSGIKQRYYPQCASCSQKQAAAIRNDRSHRVFHRVLHSGGRGTGWHYIGVWIGTGHHIIEHDDRQPRSRKKYYY